ncbi:MAG: CFI-box-CTERM domain-containing protein [Candidatus Bathyarchaeia archaeon]
MGRSLSKMNLKLYPLILIIVILLPASFNQAPSLRVSGQEGYSSRQYVEDNVSIPLCGGVIRTDLEVSEKVYGAPASGAVGGGDITLIYHTSFPVDYRSYVQTLFDIVYPEIKTIYGDPSNTITVTLKYDRDWYPWNFYIPANNTIVLSQLPSPSGTSPTWDAIFTHELIHAFHDAIVLTETWAEEGMTEAATQIVAMNLKNKGVRDIVYRDPIVNLKYYDVWSYMGSRVVGGTPNFFLKFNPDISYRISSAMFFILTCELSTSTSNPYDFLKRLNQALYSEAPANPYFDDLRFKLAIRQVAAGRLVEGQLADVWVGYQPITYTLVRTGFHIGVYPYRPENPTRVWVMTFLRSSYGEETPMGGLRVNVKVMDVEGRVVNSGQAITGSDGMGYLDLSPTPYQAGGYEIVASTIFSDINYTARNYAFSQGESRLIEQPDMNLYGVTLDSSGKPVPATVTATGGTVKLNTRGAFKIEASTQTLPLEITLSSGGFQRKFGKPNPYTRVVWMNSTAPSPTPYTVTVKIQGLPSTYSTTLQVDGTVKGTVQGGGTATLTFDMGTTHTIQVDSYVNVSSTERYHASPNIQVVTSEATVTFTYLRQVYILFQQNGSGKPVPATIDGTIYTLPVSFWWTSGSNHSFTYAGNLTDETTRYLLVEVSSRSPLTVTDPLTVTGLYKTQYMLNISTIPSGLIQINGSGWYDSRSKVTLTAPPLSGYTFKAWMVDGSETTSNPVEVTMDAPRVAVAIYQSLGSYDVTVRALYAPTGEETEAQFTWDGKIYTTPYTFRTVTGSHTVVAAATDKAGRTFSKWQDIASNTTSRTISSGGVYIAIYGQVKRDFSISISPDHQRIGPGQSTFYVIRLESLGGFNLPVTLGVKGMPVNSNSTFNPRTLQPPGTATLTINTYPTTPVGSYVLTVTAVGDNIVHTVQARLSMGACIVATATYGSELSGEVQFLRGFRDNQVRKTFAGESFMSAFNIWYYSFSPYVADYINQSSSAKSFARLILHPLIKILYVASTSYKIFQHTPEFAVYTSGFVASFLIGTVYFSPALAPILLFKRRLSGTILRLTSMTFLLSSVLSFTGEFTGHSGLMMVATSCFVISTITASILLSAKILSIICGFLRKFRSNRPTGTL